jgi:uncharacterized membrane protein
VDALPFLDQLATRAGVSAGTYSDLADATVTLGQMLAAAGAVLNTQDGGTNTAAIDGLNQLSLQLPSSASMTLGQVINLALWQKREIGSIVQQDSGQVRLNMLEVVTAAARVYGAGHLVTTSSATTIPVAGSVTISTNMAVGSPMTGVALSPKGTSISTAQARLAITIQSNTQIPLGLGSVFVSLPVYLQIAQGTATASDIPCIKGGTRAVITASAKAGNAQIGTVSQAGLTDFSTDPTVGQATFATVTVDLGIIKVPVAINIGGTIPVAQVDGQPLAFDQGTIDAGTPQTAAGSSSGHVFSGITNPTVGFSFSVAQALVGTVNSTLNTLVKPLLTPLLNALLAALDPAAEALLHTLGLRLGAIDVVVRGVSCGTPTLVH